MNVPWFHITGEGEGEGVQMFPETMTHSPVMTPLKM